MLQIVDAQWKDHLYSLDHLKEGIGLRGYGQRDPLVEYKKESYELFQDMKERIEEEMVRYVFWLRPVMNEEAAGGWPRPRGTARRRQSDDEQAGRRIGRCRPSPGGALRLVCSARQGSMAATPRRPQPARTGGDDVVKTVRREEPKVGRNDPCPCGSGKKYKKCHGAAA